MKGERCVVGRRELVCAVIGLRWACAAMMIREAAEALVLGGEAHSAGGLALWGDAAAAS